MTTALSLKQIVNATYEFSNQEIVDCNKPQNGGCNGGWFSGVYEYAKTHAISPESNYPYTADDGTCNTTLQGSGLYKIKSYTTFSAKKKFSKLKQNLAAYGPQAIAVAVNDGFAEY